MRAPLIVMLLITGQASAHSGQGTAAELFHMHGAEVVGAGIAVLSLLVALCFVRVNARGRVAAKVRRWLRA
ncbi:MAG: hypothetical protein KBT87_07415 [Gammaproteobacteria bacterium]|nr:hypothetical protein [Gammaproteobacteria bacterium]MBQ0774480.1 hypothetical protein [Gammaproteobacteria bacterium]